MLPSGVPPLSQPSRQPSEAAYGRSGRPREVGAIRRCVLTSDGIAACPHPLVRREHAPGPCHGTAAASGRYTPTDLEQHPLEYYSTAPSAMTSEAARLSSMTRTSALALAHGRREGSVRESRLYRACRSNELPLKLKCVATPTSRSDRRRRPPRPGSPGNFPSAPCVFFCF